MIAVGRNLQVPTPTSAASTVRKRPTENSAADGAADAARAGENHHRSSGTRRAHRRPAADLDVVELVTDDVEVFKPGSLVPFETFLPAPRSAAFLSVAVDARGTAVKGLSPGVSVPSRSACVAPVIAARTLFAAPRPLF